MQRHAGNICACCCMARFLNCLVPSLILLPRSGTMPPSSSSSSSYHHPSSVIIFQPWRITPPCTRWPLPLLPAWAFDVAGVVSTTFCGCHWRWQQRRRPSNFHRRQPTTSVRHNPIEHNDYDNTTIIIWGGRGYIKLWWASIIEIMMILILHYLTFMSTSPLISLPFSSRFISQQNKSTTIHINYSTIK